MVEGFRFDVLTIPIDEHVDRRLRAEFANRALGDPIPFFHLVSILHAQIDRPHDRVFLRTDHHRADFLTVGQAPLLDRHPPPFCRENLWGVVYVVRLLDRKGESPAQDIDLGRVEGLLRANLFTVRGGDEIEHLFDRLGLVVRDPLQFALLHPQKPREEARHSLEIPEMNDRARQGDMPHIHPAHRRIRHLDMTLLTRDPFVLLSLVLPAGTLVVVLRPEDLLCIEATPFGAVSSIVDRLRLSDLPMRPTYHRRWRCKLELHPFDVIARNQ